MLKDVVSEALNIEEIDPREEKDEMSLVEEFTKIVLDTEHPDQFISINSLLEPEL